MKQVANTFSRLVFRLCGFPFLLYPRFCFVFALFWTLADQPFLLLLLSSHFQKGFFHSPGQKIHLCCLLLALFYVFTFDT